MCVKVLCLLRWDFRREVTCHPMQKQHVMCTQLMCSDSWFFLQFSPKTSSLPLSLFWVIYFPGFSHSKKFVHWFLILLIVFLRGLVVELQKNNKRKKTKIKETKEKYKIFVATSFTSCYARVASRRRFLSHENTFISTGFLSTQMSRLAASRLWLDKDPLLLSDWPFISFAVDGAYSILMGTILSAGNISDLGPQKLSFDRTMHNQVEIPNGLESKLVGQEPTAFYTWIW